VEDIEKLIRDYRVAGVFFREDHFTHSAERTRDFCELLLRKGVRTKWLCESRVHPLDLDLLPLMKRAGCEWIFFGCESGSDRLLQALKKGICAEHIRRALNECNRLGIKAFTTWLVNVPGETRQDRKATIRLIEETWPFKVAVGVFVGLPGSELRDEMERNGEVAVVDDLGMAYSRRYNHLVYHHYGIASRQYVRRDGRVGGAPLLFRMAHPFYSALRRLRWLTLRAWRRLHGKRQR
jgi:radical SAM superfamily enzyme YgiQ (UPF0313 family)